MTSQPIYEPEPLPSEDGSTTGAVSGLTHSAYQRARLRQIKDATQTEINVPSYKPKNVVSESAVTEGVLAARNAADAIRRHVRKQMLNARQPGLGNFIGPLPEKVQGAVSAATEPLVNQVVGYTMKKYREGTAFTKTPVPIKQNKTIKHKPSGVRYEDLPEKNRAIPVAPRSQEARDSEARATHEEVLSARAGRIAVPAGGTLPTAPEGKVYNMVGRLNHPDVGHHTYYDLADDPNPAPKPTLAELNRAKRTEAESKKQTAALNALKAHATANFTQYAANHPEAHPEEIRSLTEAHYTGQTFDPESRALRTAAGLRSPRQVLSALNSHLSALTAPLKDEAPRAQAIKERAARSNVDVSRMGGSSSEDEFITDDAPARRTRTASSPAYTAAARELARQHWSSTDNGKLAGEVKNVLTGELHPKWEQTTHFRNPKAYIKKNFGVNDVDKYLDEQRPELVQKHAAAASTAGTGEWDVLEPGSGKITMPPKAPSSTFALDFAKNPVAAQIDAAQRPAPKPSQSLKARVDRATSNDLGALQLEARSEGRAARMNSAFKGE